MSKTKKLYVLLGVLLLICVSAFGISKYQEKKEDIKNSGEEILKIDSDDVTSLSWEIDDTSLSFTKGDSWKYDGDSSFPVDEDKINDLLEDFKTLNAAFIIENVDDYSQYGLDKPKCTINISTDDNSYSIKLGDFSTMDEQRYISIGDGNVYLIEDDPYDDYDIVLDDLMLNDKIPSFDNINTISVSSDNSYTITYKEDSKSICEDDVYFIDDKPLDTDNVKSFMAKIKAISLTNYATYDVSDEKLSEYGLNNPIFKIDVDYIDDEDTGNFTINISANSDDLEEYKKAKENDEDDLPVVTYYVRLNDSKIIYEISQTEFNNLNDVSYDTLRHEELFTADFDSVTSIDVSLNGEDYTLSYKAPNDEDDVGTWTYNENEYTSDTLKEAIMDLKASEFTSITPSGQEEISLTIHLDNEDFNTLSITLYRYDGSNCIAKVNGEVVALVSRSQTVDLIEAVNEITLGS